MQCMRDARKARTQLPECKQDVVQAQLAAKRDSNTCKISTPFAPLSYFRMLERIILRNH